MKQKAPCKLCLWNWPDLNGGPDRICYREYGPYYHMQCPKEACSKWEIRVFEGKNRGECTQNVGESENND